MLAHERTGSGTPLLLLHGLGMCKEVWRPVIPLLAREHEVIAVDLPGFGDSRAGAETVDEMADELVAFTGALGLEQPHVAGNSMGGGLALALATRGRVRSACAISPIGFANDREALYARGVLAATRFLALGAAPIASAVAANPVTRTLLCSHVAGRPWRIPAGDAAMWTRVYAEAPGFWPLLRSAPTWDVEPPVCPTTVAWGDRDRLLIYSRQARRSRRMLPAARHVTLHGCGHVPTWDDPEQVARVILESDAA
jgi:pimeloyl-ACP methyl ester carboxylesterase